MPWSTRWTLLPLSCSTTSSICKTLRLTSCVPSFNWRTLTRDHGEITFGSGPFLNPPSISPPKLQYSSRRFLPPILIDRLEFDSTHRALCPINQRVFDKTLLLNSSIIALKKPSFKLLGTKTRPMLLRAYKPAICRSSSDHDLEASTNKTLHHSSSCLGDSSSS